MISFKPFHCDLPSFPSVRGQLQTLQPGPGSVPCVAAYSSLFHFGVLFLCLVGLTFSTSVSALLPLLWTDLSLSRVVKPHRHVMRALFYVFLFVCWGIVVLLLCYLRYVLIHPRPLH